MLWAGMLSGVVLAMIPSSADAQVFRRPFHGCCETCTQPHAHCTCSQTQAVVQTQLHAQQVTTYRDVVETHVRNETVIQNVPVTTYKQVTVDEGGYQMVWVPKPVTKQVAQTVIQQQAQTRAVPYQVVRKVPQTSTQLVPVHTVHHVTTTTPVITTWAPPPVTFQAARSCNTCDSPFGTAFVPQYIPIQSATLPTQVAPAPVVPQTSSIQTMPAISVPLPQTARGPSPTPAPEQWQTIPSKSSINSSRYDSPASVPVPMEEARHTGAAGRFVAAPTAATVWNSRR
jgi:hypothetical protein